MPIDRENPFEDVEREVQAMMDFLRYTRNLGIAEALATLATSLGCLAGISCDREHYDTLVRLAETAFEGTKNES